MRQLLDKPRELAALLAISFSFFLLRFPSLFEPNWYGDEGIYQAIGIAMREGRMLYSEIWDNKPPMLYVFYALVNGDQFLIRLLSLIFGVLSVIAFFYLAKKLFNKYQPSVIATALFAVLFGIPMFEGNIANAENFMLLPTMLAGYLVLQFQAKEQPRQLFIAGLLLGLAFLFKIVAIFDLFAFTLFLILPLLPSFRLLRSKDTFHKIIRAVIPLRNLWMGFLLPFCITALFFLISGSLVDFLQAAFITNVGYVDVENNFFIPQGLLIIRLLILALFISWVLHKKNKLSRPLQFVFIWLAFSLFSAYFSNRPYTHYLLLVLPAFSLAIGMLLTLNKKTARKFAVMLTIVAVFLYQTFWHFTPQKTVEYYTNFLAFIQNKSTVRSYQAFFDSRTPRDYDVASYLKLHLKKGETFFLWGNSAQLYALTQSVPPGKYTVAYHMTADDSILKDAVNQLEVTKPRFVVLTPDLEYIPFYLHSYQLRATIDGVDIYERIF